MSNECNTQVLKQTSSIDDDYIKTIESLYPPDSIYHTTAGIGKALMIQAILMGDWRDLPGHVLCRMALLCRQQDIEETKRNHSYQQQPTTTRRSA